MSAVTAAPSERLKWAGEAHALAELGLESMDVLYAPTAERIARLEPLAGSRSRWRFPLPGTPDARGNLVGKPRALGTGWLWLTVFRGGLAELLRARCTRPRSASLAEREWNLICHLRAHGVGTPEPLLVGARGNGFVSARSFVLVRAPEDAFPLPRWLRTDGIGAERERGLVALGKTLALLVRSGVELPELQAEHVWITPSGSGECETEGPALRKNRMPGVSIVEVGGGRVRRTEDGRIARAQVGRVLAGVELEETERRRVMELAMGESGARG